jgi:hypothetical protein
MARGLILASGHTPEGAYPLGVELTAIVFAFGV